MATVVTMSRESDVWINCFSYFICMSSSQPELFRNASMV
jgi:hypothetical protein